MSLSLGCVCRTTLQPNRTGIFEGAFGGRAKVRYPITTDGVQTGSANMVMVGLEHVFALDADQPIKKAVPCAPQAPSWATPQATPSIPMPAPGAPGTGAKWDAGKPQFELFAIDCAHAELGIVQVMTWAVQVKGYVPGSWQTVPEAIKRYGAALRRHQSAKARGERYDKESGLLHDFHIATNAVFVAELEARVDRAKGCAVFEYNKVLPKA